MAGERTRGEPATDGTQVSAVAGSNAPSTSAAAGHEPKADSTAPVEDVSSGSESGESEESEETPEP
jgi:hypothetical protein